MIDTSSSILDQIMHKRQAQESALFKPKEVLAELFKSLNVREKDILSKRFSLDGLQKQTLEEIGRLHSITRERVRQLIADSIKKIKKKDGFSSQIKPLKRIVTRLLERYGGLMEEELLLEMLESLSQESEEAESKGTLKNQIKFIISELFDDELVKLKDSELKSCWRLKLSSLDLLKQVLAGADAILKEKGQPLSSEELLAEASKKSFFENLKTNLPGMTGDFPHLSLPGLSVDRELGAAEEIFLSYLLAAQKIKQNVFGQWGIREWNTITPKRMNDKVYLLLKKLGKPLHYRDITKQINEIKFDKKQANAETIHNELIMDNRYVLVGRGIYALKEWGYKKGTVAQVIIDLIKKDGPLSKQEILKKVLEQRLVKEATIQLALMNKDRFKRQEDGRYALVETTLKEAPAEPQVSTELEALEQPVQSQEEVSSQEENLPEEINSHSQTPNVGQ